MELREFFADRVDCLHLGRAVIISGELLLAGEMPMGVSALRCSHREQCAVLECELLASGSGAFLATGEGARRGP